MHGKKNIIIPYSETTTGTIGSLVYNPTNSLESPTTTTTTTTSRVVHFPRTKNTTSNLYSLGKGRSSSSNIANNTANIATTYENIPRIPQALALHMLKKTLVHLKAHHEDTLSMIEERDKIRLRLAIQDSTQRRNRSASRNKRNNCGSKNNRSRHSVSICVGRASKSLSPWHRQTQSHSLKPTSSLVSSSLTSGTRARRICNDCRQDCDKTMESPVHALC